jgi:hypothetical protein
MQRKEMSVGVSRSIAGLAVGCRLNSMNRSIAAKPASKILAREDYGGQPMRADFVPDAASRPATQGLPLWWKLLLFASRNCQRAT